MISRTAVSLKKLKGKHITIETKKYRIVKVKKLKKLPKGTIFLIPSTDKERRLKLARKRRKKKVGRPRKVGRPKKKTTRKKRVGRPRKKRSSLKRRLPPRVKTGKRKGQFRKRK